MPKGNQGTKRSNKEDSSGSQNSKASRHTACSVYAQSFPADQEHYVEARAVAGKRKIRSDGSQPSSSRCKRLGHQCSDMVTRKNDASKLAFSQALETLDARLGTCIAMWTRSNVYVQS